ncbi:helix-turn-helix transcriptional regulator [Dethiosulfatarculus sandiegensis]|nr:AraC family transcriptional regulator [Dethiosulfatarculus sandiegensis]
MQSSLRHCRGALRELDCPAGMAGILYLPNTEMKACYAPLPVRGVALDIDPPLLRDMLAEDYRFMPVFLKRVLLGSCEQPVLQNLSLSPSLSSVLAQMLVPLEQNNLSNLFLEGKSLELLGLLLNALRDGGRPRFSRISPDKAEREKIHHAKEILFSDLANPPGLLELAGRVGLSHTTLNRGFKSLFGMTAFACLRERRLQEARELLEQGGLTIAQVALLSGFSDQSHLTRAFSAYFGLPPKKYIHSL